ncbi:MAG: hypothetical protein M3519_04670 [Actinomycetota bacterium]|nr:hypothetical protein [Actinomycetota bacterium]
MVSVRHTTGTTHEAAASEDHVPGMCSIDLVRFVPFSDELLSAFRFAAARP